MLYQFTINADHPKNIPAPSQNLMYNTSHGQKDYCGRRRDNEFWGNSERLPFPDIRLGSQ